MAGKKRPSSADAEDYESDGGFVEDAPKSKKAKTVKTSKTSSSAAKSEAGGGQVGKDGDVFWELSGTRRIGISKFKGKRIVNIREYYEKDGEMLPGKKGISLPTEQFNAIIKLLPQIETALSDQGESIERPDYSGSGPSAAVDADEDMEEQEAQGKKNFEQTSEEEEE